MKKGRPKIKINWEDFDKLCELHCTLTEIAGWFNCTVDTIENRVKQEKGMIFSEYYEQKASNGKIALRRKQWQTAMKGNVVMQIFLGKQILNQTDKTSVIHSGGINSAIVLKDLKDLKSDANDNKN